MSEDDREGRNLLPELDPPAVNRLRALTPARVALGRTGVSLPTRARLDFDRCHAMARDAVHARLNSAALAAEIESGIRPEVLRLHSAAANRTEYLQRPDLGRRLNAASRALLAEQPDDRVDIALIIADGLSALAVERHAAALLSELLPLMSEFLFAPICIVEQGRVAIGDEIGLALNAQIAVILIGERPGLSSPDSLGIYITWDPRPGRMDAERNCISNIRVEGLSYMQAAAQLSAILSEARRLRLTGVALKPQTQTLIKG
ncbi:MAG TPA: ethanolamine ammonia-lyase subunit EutC [Terracidiphilus sp.]|nr:ethanolamine ammonia-lyase subunit EutC [Terracidiphilus sp.]